MLERGEGLMADIEQRTRNFLAAFHRQFVEEAEEPSLTVESISEFEAILACAISKNWVTADGGLVLTEKGLEEIDFADPRTLSLRLDG